jgi:5-methylcytosine-specific restriction endonuclease McrA
VRQSAKSLAVRKTAGNVVSLADYRAPFRTAAQIRKLDKRERALRDRDHGLARSAKRRAAKMQRAVPWADPAAIAAIYREAAEITRRTGIPHEVDHVIPLLGRRVSGLHIETNLQILTKRENARKSNKA